MRTYYSLLMICLLVWFAIDQVYFWMVLATVPLAVSIGGRYFPESLARIDVYHILVTLSLTVLVWDWRFFGNAALILFWTSIIPVLLYDTFFKRA